jgi:hypothetical protein
VVQWLWLTLSKGSNRVGVSPSSPEDGNRSSFRNVYSLLFRILDDGRSPETHSFLINVLFEEPVSTKKKQIPKSAKVIIKSPFVL